MVVAENDQKTNRRPTTYMTTGTDRRCKNCGEQHGIWTCPDYKSQSVTQRWQLAKQFGLCYRCLGDNHRGRDCRRGRVCGIDGCKGTHHRLLHEGQRSNGNPTGGDNKVNPVLSTEREQSDQRPKAEAPQTVMTGSEKNEKFVMMRTVPVIVKNGGRKMKINALLDDASTSTFINGDIASELGLQGQWFRTEVSIAVRLNLTRKNSNWPKSA